MRNRVIPAAIFLLLMARPAKAGQKKFIGTIWQKWSSENAAPASLSELFNQVTPENAGKWGGVNYGQLDAMYAYAEKHGFQTKQHTFVWGQQSPGGGTSAQAVENWIKGYMERYGDQVDLIDVVNEAFTSPPGYKNAIGGDGQTGWDWIIWAFQTSRKYAPNSKLLINDFWILGSREKATKYRKVIELLKDRGLVDGIGLQAHGLEDTDLEVIKGNLDFMAETGIPIYISEFDISMGDDAQHLFKFSETFALFWEHPMVAGVTLWGYQQGRTWRPNAHLERSNGSLRPSGEWMKKYVKDNPQEFTDPVATGINNQGHGRNSKALQGAFNPGAVSAAGARAYNLLGSRIEWTPSSRIPRVSRGIRWARVQEHR